MIYSLPKTAKVGEEELEIRYDYRVILTILELLNDPDLGMEDKAEGMIDLFYMNPEKIRDYKAAVEECYRFIDLGQTDARKPGPRLMDWEQDFPYIVAPVNRIMGKEIREIPYDFDENTGGLHWWTFMGAYMEIGGNCMFSQLISIREKRAKGKKLEKHEREWLRRNIDIVEFKRKYSEAENDIAKDWMGGGKNG